MTDFEVTLPHFRLAVQGRTDIIPKARREMREIRGCAGRQDGAPDSSGSMTRNRGIMITDQNHPMPAAIPAFHQARS